MTESERIQESAKRLGVKWGAGMTEPPPTLREAAEAVWRLIEEGKLVRSTEGDDAPDWAIKQIPVVRALADLQAALAAQPQDAPTELPQKGRYKLPINFVPEPQDAREVLETLNRLKVLAESLPHEQSEDPEQGMVPNESCAHCWIILSVVPQLSAALKGTPP